MENESVFPIPFSVLEELEQNVEFLLANKQKHEAANRIYNFLQVKRIFQCENLTSLYPTTNHLIQIAFTAANIYIQLTQNISINEDLSITEEHLLRSFHLIQLIEALLESSAPPPPPPKKEESEHSFSSRRLRLSSVPSLIPTTTSIPSLPPSSRVSAVPHKQIPPKQEVIQQQVQLLLNASRYFRRLGKNEIAFLFLMETLLRVEFLIGSQTHAYTLDPLYTQIECIFSMLTDVALVLNNSKAYTFFATRLSTICLRNLQQWRKKDSLCGVPTSTTRQREKAVKTSYRRGLFGLLLRFLSNVRNQTAESLKVAEILSQKLHQFEEVSGLRTNRLSAAVSKTVQQMEAVVLGKRRDKGIDRGDKGEKDDGRPMTERSHTAGNFSERSSASVRFIHQYCRDLISFVQKKLGHLLHTQSRATYRKLEKEKEVGESTTQPTNGANYKISNSVLITCYLPTLYHTTLSFCETQAAMMLFKKKMRVDKKKQEGTGINSDSTPFSPPFSTQNSDEILKFYNITPPQLLPYLGNVVNHTNRYRNLTIDVDTSSRQGSVEYSPITLPHTPIPLLPPLTMNSLACEYTTPTYASHGLLGFSAIREDEREGTLNEEDSHQPSSFAGVLGGRWDERGGSSHGDGFGETDDEEEDEDDKFDDHTLSAFESLAENGIIMTGIFDEYKMSKALEECNHIFLGDHQGNALRFIMGEFTDKFPEDNSGIVAGGRAGVSSGSPLSAIIHAHALRMERLANETNVTRNKHLNFLNESSDSDKDIMSVTVASSLTSDNYHPKKKKNSSPMVTALVSPSSAARESLTGVHYESNASTLAVTVDGVEVSPYYACRLQEIQNIIQKPNHHWRKKELYIILLWMVRRGEILGHSELRHQMDGDGIPTNLLEERIDKENQTGTLVTSINSTRNRSKHLTSLPSSPSLSMRNLTSTKTSSLIKRLLPIINTIRSDDYNQTTAEPLISPSNGGDALPSEVTALPLPLNPSPIPTLPNKDESTENKNNIPLILMQGIEKMQKLSFSAAITVVRGLVMRLIRSRKENPSKAARHSTFSEVVQENDVEIELEAIAERLSRPEVLDISKEITEVINELLISECEQLQLDSNIPSKCSDASFPKIMGKKKDERKSLEVNKKNSPQKIRKHSEKSTTSELSAMSNNDYIPIDVLRDDINIPQHRMGRNAEKQKVGLKGKQKDFIKNKKKDNIPFNSPSISPRTALANKVCSFCHSIFCNQTPCHLKKLL